MISLSKLLAYHRLGEQAKIQYNWGSKPALAPGLDPSQIIVSDCSGWFRYLLYHASYHSLVLPEGSGEQWELMSKWATEGSPLFLGPLSFEQAMKAAAWLAPGKNNLLAWWIETPEERHVWLTYENWTLECYGGYGVGSRWWQARIMDGAHTLAGFSTGRVAIRYSP